MVVRMEQEKKSFIGYEYKEFAADAGQVSMYLDCYENFGWIAEEQMPDKGNSGQVTLRLKRDRKIMNKMELTRLQRNFEACTLDLKKLEKAKTSAAIAWALAVGMAGTVFMACSTFAVTHEPPIIWLCVLFAVPGIIGWILPYFVYRRLVQKQTEKIEPLIEQKWEEIYEVCEKGHSLL